LPRSWLCDLSLKGLKEIADNTETRPRKQADGDRASARVVRRERRLFWADAVRAEVGVKWGFVMPEEKQSDAVENFLADRKAFEDRKQALIDDLLRQKAEAVKAFDEKLAKQSLSCKLGLL
jgi:hypothetical protein